MDKTVSAPWERVSTSMYIHVPSPVQTNDSCIIYSYPTYFIMYAWMSHTGCGILEPSHLSRPATITQLKDGLKEILTQARDSRRRLIFLFVRNAPIPFQVKSRGNGDFQHLKIKKSEVGQQSWLRGFHWEVTQQTPGLAAQQKSLWGTNRQLKFSSWLWRYEAIRNTSLPFHSSVLHPQSWQHFKMNSRLVMKT